MQTPKTSTISLEVPPRGNRIARQPKIPGSDSDSVPSPGKHRYQIQTHSSENRAPNDRSPKVPCSLEVPPRGNHTARKLKLPGPDSDLVPSQGRHRYQIMTRSAANRILKDISPEAVERKSPPAYEKKHPDRAPTMEAYKSLAKELKESKTRANSLEAKLNMSESEIHDMKNILEEKEHSTNELKAKLEKKEADLAELNETLKIEIAKREMETNTSSKRAVRILEGLEVTQGVNLELEAELRRLKVHSDQWRKAAEAAASVLSTYLDDMDDDITHKKKKANILKKIGVLLKKGHK